MINTIYLIKRDVDKPYSQENWLTMNVNEFNAFVKTQDAKGRYFADVGGHEYSDTWYILECPKETAMKWRKELNRHYYLKRMERESGYQTVSYHDLVIGDEVINGEEIITDVEDNFVAEVMHKIDLETLEKALDKLPLNEYEMIYRLYLSEYEISEREYARILGIPQKTLNSRKLSVIDKMRNIFGI